MKSKIGLLFLLFVCSFVCKSVCVEGVLDKESLSYIEENIETNLLAVGYEDACFQLADYYYFKEKCYRKAMYWAFKGAKKGSSDCMLLLRTAYGAGFGVIQDTEECLKWLVLAAAIGNEDAQREVSVLERPNYKLINLLPDAEARSLIQDHEVQWREVRKRAKIWLDANQSLFLNKD